ncbi:hypothetical protein F5Y17DRAFT_411693 [Xylariaceae sp. FL0594]|nr:hypothetical protein F5Y17DRAFT_411693 [Xylariaceae sp. FL0594]
MGRLLHLFALLGLASVGAHAEPTAALLADLLPVVSLLEPPLITDILTTTTTYPATAPTSYTSSAYNTGCDCWYSTIFWWTPHPYPTSAPATSTRPGSTVTVTSTVTSTTDVPTTITSTVTSTTQVPTTTTVTATATVTAPCTPSLSCDKYGYLIQNVTLYRVDLTTGKFNLIKDHIGDNTDVNAIGYNVLDNLLYARQSGKNELIRIGADGSTASVATFAENKSVNVGDIDTDGFYWYGYAGRTWHQLDLRPGSTTYGKLLANGTMDNLGLNIADWAYVPEAGSYLWSAARVPAGGSALVRFSLETKTWEIVRRFPNVGGSTFGAVYGINNGTIYASDNSDGRVWAFPLTGGAPRVASQGPVSPGLNDGARCVLNLRV